MLFATGTELFIITMKKGETMTGSGFDLGMSILLILCSILFFLGLGDSLLGFFSGNANQKKRSADGEKKFQRAVGVLLLFLGILQGLLYFFSQAWIPIVCLVGAIVGITIFILYYRRIS